VLINIPDKFVMSNKSIILCLITLCVHLLIVWFLYSPYNELGIIKNFRIEIDSLNKVNDSLYSDIKNNKLIIDKYTQELNVLENKKQTVIIKYKTKVNEIDTLNNNNLVAEFDSIFSKFTNK
jgi:hypothetical protein